ncbi:Amino-acid acetyltransferase, mitochondrial [Pseudocercospora fuligena]|uniref:Amino-acid acetyltransferase, mitochondrial n=1 Tax=Pseudocercospora fuligena TaxID=685502 RepID=A0A8H6RW68_9PEZI|nr:Amino-acid acetyltransferase, mitochondrial [Pseudocercospora fuligena]
MTTSMLACGKANAFGSLKVGVRQCTRLYTTPSSPSIGGTAVNGKHAARNEDPATQRELLMNVLSASATKRDAKQYLARFNRPRKDSKGEKPDLYALLEDRNARNRQDQSRLDKTGVNLGGLYAPSRAIADVPQFSSEEVTREQAKAAPQEELHVALACLKAPEAIDEDTLDGLARTIAQLVKLDMRIILVLDININNVQAEKYAGSLVDVKALRKAFAQQADRLCDAIDRHNSEGARSVPNALEVVEDVWENGTETHELHVTMPNTLIDPLKRGMIPIIPSLAYTASGQLVQIAAADIMTTITKYLIGVDSAGQQIAGPPEPISLDRIIVLDAIGGIPSKDRGDGAHVFINLEQEFDNIEQELSEYADAAERNHSHPRGSAFYDQHRENLDLVRKCLQLLPASSSALIATPEEAASSSRATKAPTLGAGTRRQKNPLIHNLLTNKPLISSSLPAARLHHAEGEDPNTPLTEASTVLRRGMPLIVIPAADRYLGWQRPKDGKSMLRLDQDSRVDLPRLVHLIEDSFRRKLNVQNYLNRVKDRIAGIIVAGQYEGGAILTWEMPPGVNDPNRLVPYLDKFAVLQTSQGSSGVADIVFQAMVRSCFPQGVCWRSRKDNPVNKWYFERAAGSWQIPNSNWTMFWTGEDVVENEQKWEDYVAVCESIQASWDDDGKKPD